MSIILRRPYHIYYTKFSVRGTLVRHSTGVHRPAKYSGSRTICQAEMDCSQYREALRWEKAKKAAVEEGRLADLEASKRRKTGETIGAILDIYSAWATRQVAAGRLVANTRTQAMASFRAFCSEVFGSDYRSLSISRLDRAAVRKFQDGRLIAAGDPERRWQCAAGINAAVRKARSIFSQSAQDHYRDLGITIPDSLSGWLRVPALKEPDHAFALPDEHMIARMDTDAMSWPDADMRRAYLLMRGAGMRNGAVLHARWDWIEEVGGLAVLVVRPRAYWRPKRMGETRIPVDPQVLEELLRGVGTPDPDAWIIMPECESRSVGSAAYNLVYRKLSLRMRDYFPDGAKSAYNLRKLAGSEILRQTGSIEAAAAYLGNTPEVCRRHYATLRLTHTVGLRATG